MEKRTHPQAEKRIHIPDLGHRWKKGLISI
jgi:hypothetical protein